MRDCCDYEWDIATKQYYLATIRIQDDKTKLANEFNRHYREYMLNYPRGYTLTTDEIATVIIFQISRENYDNYLFNRYRNSGEMTPDYAALYTTQEVMKDTTFGRARASLSRLTWRRCTTSWATNSKN